MRTFATLFCLTVPLVPAPETAARQRLSFALAEGTVLEKQFSRSVELSVDEWELTLNGEDMIEDERPEIEASFGTELSFRDEYRSVGESRPLRLARTFSTLETSIESSTPEGEFSAEGESELEGATVVFTWDEDDEAYSLAFEPEDGGDDELLEGLVEDCDLRAALPPGAVEVGESWTLDNRAMYAVLEPGGNLHFLDPDGDPLQDEADEFDDPQGDCEATFLGLRDVDEVELAVIGLRLELSGEKETTGVDGDGDPTVHTASIEFELEGELLWHPTEHRPVSLELTGTLSTLTVDQVNWTDEDGDYELIDTTGFDGQARFAYTWTRVE
jgi:hypothetical protein